MTFVLLLCACLCGKMHFEGGGADRWQDRDGRCEVMTLAAWRFSEVYEGDVLFLTNGAVCYYKSLDSSRFSSAEAHSVCIVLEVEPLVFTLHPPFTFSNSICCVAQIFDSESYACFVIRLIYSSA